MSTKTWYRAATMVGAATLLVGGPAWAGPQPAPHAAAVAPSNSDLEAVRIDPDPAPAGGLTELHAHVANLGPETTGSTMTITVVLPRGTAAEEPFYPDNCTESENHRRLRCTFPAGLKSQRTATAIIPIRFDDDVEPGVLRGGSFTVQSPDDRNHANNHTEFDLTVTAG
ncbi:hypothetical protein [Streptomyces vinaceus]|uniref:hypothetical protein n=1 Tax=Streptomyces vinaceus TaxID=1960 RepID=UPI00369118DF